MKRKSDAGATMFGCALIAGLVLLALLLGGWLLEYVVETWVGAFGKAIDVPHPHIATILVGAVLSEILVPLGLVTWFLAVINVL